MYAKRAASPRRPAAVDPEGDGAINGEHAQRPAAAFAAARRWGRRLPIGTRRRAAATVALGVALFVAGCGVIGGDDPTEVPTSAITAPTPAASPAGAQTDGSPAVASPGPTRTTEIASPAAVDETETPAETPVASTGDATAEGETPPADETATAADETAEATARPRRTATPARPTRTPEPPPASGCAPPAPLPEVRGAEERFATETINLRAGPGGDCEIIRAIDLGSAVTVTSGPVEADDRLWVRVEAAGDEGWVAEEFLAEEGATIDATATEEA